MLTIITYEELEKLYRDHKLEKSESFDFLADTTKKFLGEVFNGKFETKMAHLIHVHSVGGKEVNQVSKEILDNVNDDVLSYLPLLDGDQICIVTKPTDKVIKFSNETLDDLESTSFSNEEEKEFYQEVLLDANSLDGDCVYAVSPTIKLEEVVAVLYAEELEDRVAALKEADEGRGVLFKTTALFS